jgi:uncharacterized protein (TIGR03437 family)
MLARTHYFRGASRRAARNFARVRTRAVYPGIDLIFHGRAAAIEYDFVVAPGADPQRIAWTVAGALPRVNAAGELELADGIGWKRPEAYQEWNGRRVAVAASFAVDGHRVRFTLGKYDRARELVIDPVLAFSTFAGKSEHEALRGIGVDGAGNVYVAGTTRSRDLPRTVGPAFAGQQGNPLFPIGDAFVAKFNAAGALVYLTYLGGEWEDCAVALAVDRAGNAYVTGFSTSPDFPTTEGAIQRRQGGMGGSLILRFGDAFVTKLNPAGDQILYSTLLGGARDDAGTAITIDAAGNAYVAGVTQSTNFPVSEAAPQRRWAGAGTVATFVELPTGLYQLGDAFVAKLNTTATAITWATYLGGPQDEMPAGIAVDGAFNVYVAGHTLSNDFPVTPGALQAQNRGFDAENDFFQFGDGFVTKYNAAGTQVLYSTFLGGAGDDVITGIVVDANGSAIVAGMTSSRNLPATANAFRRVYQGPGNRGGSAQILGDGFVAKLNPAGTALTFLTYLGGESDDGVGGVALDPQGNIYLTGFTQSPGFPVTADAPQAKSGQPLAQGGGGDAFLAVLDPNATRLIFSTFLGGSSYDIGMGVAVDAAGNAYVAGLSASQDLRGTARTFQVAPAGKTDGLVARFSGFNAPAANLPVLRSVVNGASNAQGTVSPGMIFVAYGELLGPTALLGAALDGNGRLAVNRGEVVMRFDGSPAPVVYVSAGQVSGVVPYNVAGKQTVQMTLEYQGRVSAPVTLRVAETVPGLFSANSSGTGAAAALNQDGTFNSVTPAAAESVVVLFGTGEGRTAPAVTDGTVVDGIVRPVLPVTVTIGGRAAEVLYAGAAPGQVAGLFQINVKLPAGLTGRVPVVVTVGGTASQSGLTLSVE